VSARFTSNSSEATEFRFYLERGGLVVTAPAPPNPGPGAIIDLGPPGTSTPTGLPLRVWVVAANSNGAESGPSNTVCFTLSATSEGDLA